MVSFTPLSATLGGVLIGLAASLLLFGVGKVAGVSGIFAGGLRGAAGGGPWRRAFLAGLVVGGGAVAFFVPELFVNSTEPTVVSTLAAGLLVGFGTRLGSGCTSGHGVCGLSLLSPRSLVAVLTFMLTGGLTVAAVRVFGG